MGNLIRKIWYYLFNLLLVYFFEYTIVTSFANVMDNKVKHASPDQLDHVRVRDYFVILNISYQLGAFVARSSLEFIKIPQVWILTAVQAGNFIFLFFNADYFFVSSLYAVCPVFFCTGLMGGASYVNVVNCLLRLDEL